MKRNITISQAIIITCVLLTAAASAHGFAISSPPSGTTVEAGSTVAVIVDPQGTGPLVGILFDAYGTSSHSTLGSDFVILPPYRWSFQVPRGYVGSVSISAVGKVLGQTTGTLPEAENTINVKLPSNVILKSISVRKDQETLFMRLNRKDALYVYGQYSDGLERPIISGSSGTSYTSEDDKIATVTADGMVTAVGIGSTKIDIVNGSQKISVKIVVKQ